MNMRWSLDELYTSFECEAFQNDIKKLQEQIDFIKSWSEKNLHSTDCANKKIEEYINIQCELKNLASRLGAFASLTLSTDVSNEKASKVSDMLQLKMAELSKPSVMFKKWIASLENLEIILEESDLLKEHSFALKSIVKESKYALSDEEEILIAKLKNSGSNAWAKLQKTLISNLLVDITIDGEEKQLPLPVIANLYQNKDKDVRKKAYEAELKAYEKVGEGVAACLNGIKGEVITLCETRGYESPLQYTLEGSRMDKETLDALLTAMKESLPAFQKYFKKKAEMLGHKNGLPIYDRLAPIGESNKTYSYEEAREFIVNNFRTFSDKLADFADNAFENNWIDAEPRKGKRGGAFCSNLHCIKESRVLANFTGTFRNVKTLAHELGHGYHGLCLSDESPLNSSYPMPIAETASIFCETIILNSILKTASEEEALNILEIELCNNAVIIVDIMSRYLFETELFKRRKVGSLSLDEIKEIMIDSQKEAFGDGLDHNCLHPYAWANKPHYYYAERNFYNFPYAFGLLFSKGLYAEYLKRGDEFVKDYDKLLAATGKNNLVDVAKMMDIDIRSVDFWRSSLKLIEENIEKFINL